MAARIASLRRVAPDASPRVPALLAAEVPIISIEVALAAIFSSTLIGSLGVSWWVPVIAVAITVAAVIELRRISERRRIGLWSGLAVIRRGRGRMIALVLLRSAPRSHATGWCYAGSACARPFSTPSPADRDVHLGQLPIGPSLGVAAAVLILGTHGVAAAAAAGVLLTVTATVGSLCHAGCAVADRLLAGRPAVCPDVALAPTHA